MNNMQTYRNMIAGKPMPISAVPRPIVVPYPVAIAHQGVKIGRILFSLAPWAMPAAAAGMWLAYPAMGDEARRMFIPGYALLYPAPKEEADKK